MENYTWEIAQTSERLVKAICASVGVSRPIGLLLASREIDEEKAYDFLYPSLKNLSDPFMLPGLKKAAEHLWKAIHRGERILVHGDYDTDGITATVLLSGVLRENGADVQCFIPHRIDDGYGLTAECIQNGVDAGAKVIITVDCGITSYEASAKARELGIDLIITDHHEPGPEKQEATAIIDPKLGDAPPETMELAGVGVAFKVAHGFLKYGREMGYGGDDTDLKKYLDLVALGTVADIVPLRNENRSLVRYGLNVLSKQQRPGIHALCELAGVCDVIHTTDITYRLAPRLNAAGRMGDPADSLRLLEAGSMVEASQLAKRLEQQNKIRQQTEEEAIQAAEAQIVSRYDLDQCRSIVVWDRNWHQGVVGIVASRLSRRHHRPSIVLTCDQNGQFCGSGRSVRKLNLVSILDHCKEYLERFGGHAMAAGLSLEEENLDDFSEMFEEAVSTMLSQDALNPQLEIAGDVSFAELTDRFFKEIELMEPFGHSNAQPVFISRGVFPERVEPAGRSHSRGSICDSSYRNIDFIAFGIEPSELPPTPWDIAYTPQINRYAGRAIPQVRIVDIRTMS